jgi:ABC-type multidrug transport system fused ATPase/permease subunit
MLLNSVVLAVPALLTFATSAPAVRRYLRRAPKGYITEGATYSRINTTLTETVEGARTLEALGLPGERVRAGDDDIEVSAQAERYGMTLRNVLFAALNFAFQTPRVVTLLVGAYAYSRGWVDLGQITAAVLYVEALGDPLDRLIGEVDRLQVGAASTSRLLGIAEVRPDREAGDRLPDGVDLVGTDLRFAYREGHDVLHGVDLRLGVGERLAIVGPSGSGKSTLGRLLSGINRPRTGSASVGGVELVDLPLEVLRTEVALVTQEHHVFIGSVRDNIVLAREDSDDDAVREALRAVGSLLWVERLPQGLDTVIGSGRYALTPAQAQQVALARLIIADPHTLVLDEATSLIDPRTARTLEGSMNNLLEGRTVVAIAHRLHTAHDADRIAVVIDGRIVELGSHHELVELDGEYAALWRAWTS